MSKEVLFTRNTLSAKLPQRRIRALHLSLVLCGPTMIIVTPEAAARATVAAK
jgi:hypothetical protein